MICTSSVKSFWPVTRTFFNRASFDQSENVLGELEEHKFFVPKFNWDMLKLSKKEGNHTIYGH